MIVTDVIFHVAFSRIGSPAQVLVYQSGFGDPVDDALFQRVTVAVLAERT